MEFQPWNNHIGIDVGMVQAAWIDILKPQDIHWPWFVGGVVFGSQFPWDIWPKQLDSVQCCQVWGSPTLTLSSAETARSSSCPWATRHPISQQGRNAINRIWGVKKDIRSVVEWALQYYIMGDGNWIPVSVYDWYRIEPFKARATHSECFDTASAVPGNDLVPNLEPPPSKMFDIKGPPSSWHIASPGAKVGQGHIRAEMILRAQKIAQRAPSFK